MLKLLSFLPFLVFLCLACRSDYLPSEIIQYSNDPENGLRIVKQIGDLEFDLLYQTPAYIIANDERSNEISTATFNDHLEELQDLQYLRLKIGVKNGQGNITTYQVANPEAQQNRLYYLSYRFKDDLTLIQGQDTLRASFCHFERNYDLAPHRSFVLGFPQTDDLADRQLLINSSELGTGPMKFKITQKAIDRIPGIKLQHQ